MGDISHSELAGKDVARGWDCRQVGHYGSSVGIAVSSFVGKKLSVGGTNAYSVKLPLKNFKRSQDAYSKHCDFVSFFQGHNVQGEKVKVKLSLFKQ